MIVVLSNSIKELMSNQVIMVVTTATIQLKVDILVISTTDNLVIIEQFVTIIRMVVQIVVITIINVRVVLQINAIIMVYNTTEEHLV
jgi:hypothetical protein